MSVSLTQAAASIPFDCNDIRRYVTVLLQIATFFSNNLDFFTSSGYSPRGSTVALNPLQAETMLANKKKAAAYIQAIKQVSICPRLMIISRSLLVCDSVTEPLQLKPPNVGILCTFAQSRHL